MAQCGLLETEKQVIKYLESNFARWTEVKLEQVRRGRHLEDKIRPKSMKTSYRLWSLRTEKLSNFLAAPGVHIHTYKFTDSEVLTTLKLSSILNIPLVDLPLPDETTDP